VHRQTGLVSLIEFNRLLATPALDALAMSTAPAFERPFASTASALVSQWVVDEGGFVSLKRDWNLLVDAIPSHTIFLRHEWFDAAWQWRKHDANLAILVLRRGAEIAGIAPFVQTKRRRHRWTVQCLEFLAVPDTQFCDILASPNERDAVAAAVSRALLDAQWDVVNLERLTSGSATLSRLPAQLAATGLAHRTCVNERNLLIDLTQTWPQFYAQRSRRLKKANNLVANRLQRAAKKIAVERIGENDEAAEALLHAAEIVVGLSAQSWKRETGVSLDQPGPGAFFRRLVELGQGQHWLSIGLLRLDGGAVAMELQLVYRGQVHALRSDFSESFESLSPGTYLNWKLLESLFNRGLERYWFGPGENSYKLHWTAVGEPLHAVVVYGRGIRGRCLQVFETILRPWLKKLLHRNTARS